MPARYLSLHAAVVTLLPAVLTACAAASGGSTLPRAAATGECSARIVVTLRPGSGRLEPEFSAMGRTSGARLETIQSLGINTRMVEVRARGTMAACERVIDELRDHPRVQAVQQVD